MTGDRMDIGELIRGRLRTVHIIVLLVAAGTLVRAVWLGADPFWADEGRYVMASLEMMREGWLLGRFPGTEIIMSGQPPVFLYVLAVIHLLGGATEWVFRVPSLVAGVALLPLVHLWVRDHLDRRTALWVLAALAFSPVLVVYSREAITNMLGLVFQVGTLLACDRWIRSRSRRWFLAVVGLAGMAVFTHIMNTVLLALVPLYILFMDEEVSVRRLVWFVVPATVLTGLSHLFMNQGATSETGKAVIQDPGGGLLWPVWYVLGVPGHVIGFLGAVGLAEYWSAAQQVLGHYFTSSYLFLPLVGVSAGMVHAVRERDRFTGFLIAWTGLVAFTLIVPAYALYSAQGLPIDRGPMFMAVPVLLVTVIGLRSLVPRSRLWGLGLPLLLSVQLLSMPLLLGGVVVNQTGDWQYEGVIQHRDEVVCNGTELSPVFCLPQHPVGYWEGMDWKGAVANASMTADVGVPVYASMAGVVQYYAPEGIEVRSLLCNVDHRGCDIGRMLDDGERFVVLVDDSRRAWQLTEQERDRLVRECERIQVTRLFVHTCPAT